MGTFDRKTMAVSTRICLLLAVGAALLATAESKKPRTTSEWNEISKKAEIKEREEEDEERKANAPPPMSFNPNDGPMKPEQMQGLMAGQKAGKAAMVFVTIHPSPDRKTADDFAALSRSVLKDGNGLHAQAYVIEDGKDGFRLRDILLTLPLVAEFEWDQQKTPGPAFKAWKAFEDAKPKKDEEEV